MYPLALTIVAGGAAASIGAHAPAMRLSSLLRCRRSSGVDVERFDRPMLEAIERADQAQLLDLDVALAEVPGAPRSGPDHFVAVSEWASSAFERGLIVRREEDLVLTLTDRGRARLTELQA